MSRLRGPASSRPAHVVAGGCADLVTRRLCAALCLRVTEDRGFGEDLVSPWVLSRFRSWVVYSAGAHPAHRWTHQTSDASQVCRSAAS